VVAVIGNPAKGQRAIVQARYGKAGDVLSLATSYPVKAPESTEVQVKVCASSVNPIDWQMIEGNRSLIASRPFPFVPLFDLAGIVVKVGDAVTRFQVGDAVHADNKEGGGGASEFVNVPEDLVSLKPASISFAEAAAIPLAAQTALLALESGGVGAGSRICVIGASGGVGSFAVQIAKALGAAHVIGVCSGANAEFVRSLGADETIDYTRARLSEAITHRSLHAVIDCVGGREQWVEAQKVLMPSRPRNFAINPLKNQGLRRSSAPFSSVLVCSLDSPSSFFDFCAYEFRRHAAAFMMLRMRTMLYAAIANVKTAETRA